MKLNIGCGENLVDGWVNIDKYPCDEGVTYGDVEASIPFPDGCADEILLDNVVEHLSSIPKAMKEVRRLLRVGGTVTIITPHYSSQASWRDPTHNHHLSFFSFDVFCEERNRHYLGGRRFRMRKKSLSFPGGTSIFGRIIFRLNPATYERRYTFWFPASTIRATLEAI